MPPRVESPQAPQSDANPASASARTPTVRAALRRGSFWIVAGIGALLVAIAAFLLTGAAGAEGPPLAADNPAQAGSMALVEVLRQQGVTVTPVGTLAEARSAAEAGDDATVFLADDAGYLTRDQLTEVGSLAPRLVVADPDFTALQALAPAVGFGGVSPADEVSAQCDLPAATRAESISAGGKTLGLPAGAPGYTGCFPGEDRSFSMIERVTETSVLTLVADTAVFANGQILQQGNAALALNLLGTGDTLVWYLPTLADVPVTGPPSLADLTPGWVTPALVLLVVVTLTAMFWRGRRFGPLVAENLPVTVRASETREGRARLYARGNARLRAIDAIRIGAVQRLAESVGLSRTAPLDQVVTTVAALTQRPAGQVRAILVDDLPGDDAALMALSGAIEDLERATVRIVRPASAATPNSATTPGPLPSPGRMEP
jgi:hypothetical protein